MTVYYNENDPKAAEWLRHLMWEGLIAMGDVDERSIEDITPNDLVGYKQHHFFAGIGGWSYALRLAGWPDDKPVWTGSCPCQPFSSAGKGTGFADERHLWPAWFHLVRYHRPQLIVGEQVANALNWLDLVQTDLEGERYTCRATIIGAHSVGAPHIRQRLYWAADNNNNRCEARQRISTTYRYGISTTSSSKPSELGDSSSSRSRRDPGEVSRAEGSTKWRVRRELDQFVVASLDGELGNNNNTGLEGRSLSTGGCSDQCTPWSASDFVWCRDSKWRPIEPGTFPLAHGVPERVGLLRGYGNAIVPQVAAAFIQACELA
jgi:DNA (cytosine-5)-methyltransferase 1